MLVILKTTTACNLKCGYCSARAGEGERQDLGAGECEKIAKQLPELLEPDESVSWLWHGGEPTLLDPAEFSRLQGVLSTLNGHPQRVQMQTNCLEISSDWIDALLKHDVSVGVSLDGPASLHDPNRKTADGAGSHASVRQNALALAEAGVPVSLLCTLGPGHMGKASEIADWLEEMAMPVRFNPLNRLGRAQNSLSNRDYFGFLRDIFAECIKRRLAISIQPLEWMISAILNGHEAHECSYSGDCGRRFFSLGPGGEVSACSRLGHTFGNIHRQTLAEIWQGAPWRKLRQRAELPGRGKCGTCAIWRLCHGGCPAVTSQDEAECTAKKEFFDWLETDGLELYRKALIARRREIRDKLDLISAERAMLAGQGANA